eukprot:1228165-Pyramimonas_sp.AAC.1
MGAEAHGLTGGAEAPEWIRALYYETSVPNQTLGDLVEDAAYLIPVKWYDDANSLVSHLFANSGQVADRRVRAVITALRELMSQWG